MTEAGTQAYDFRPFELGDLALLGTWLRRPHVAAWWTDAEQDLADIEAALRSPDPGFGAWFLRLDGAEVGYLQSYGMANAPPVLRDQPPGTRGVDFLIGEPAHVGRGHGPAFLRLIAAHLFDAQGAPRVIADPDPGNLRSLRCFEKAGFRRDRILDFPEGPAVLMIKDRTEAQRGKTADLRTLRPRVPAGPTPR